MCGLKIPVLHCSVCVFKFLYEFFVPSAPPIQMFNPCFLHLYILCSTSKNHSGTTRGVGDGGAENPSDPEGKGKGLMSSSVNFPCGQS